MHQMMLACGHQKHGRWLCGAPKVGKAFSCDQRRPGWFLSSCVAAERALQMENAADKHVRIGGTARAKIRMAMHSRCFALS